MNKIFGIILVIMGVDLLINPKSALSLPAFASSGTCPSIIQIYLFSGLVVVVGLYLIWSSFRKNPPK
jgi:putative Mn2+ efflux pump MntP